MNEFDAIRCSWDKETDSMKIEVIPMNDIYLTPEEITLLRPEYDKYIKRYASSYDGKNALPADSLWRVTKDDPLSFDDWWRAMADNANNGKAQGG